MKRTLTRPLEASASSVIAALHDLDHVERWIGGVLEHRVEVRPAGTVDLVLKLRAPRTLALRLEVERLPDGLRYALVEGDLASVEGRITVVTEGDGASVAWDHEEAFPVGVPRVLIRELDDEVLPRWIGALAR